MSTEVITDNTKSWSGDHCVDPRLVPGVFWCNREINTNRPNLVDIAPTSLELFGVAVPSYLQGSDLFAPTPPPGVRTETEDEAIEVTAGAGGAS